MRAVVAGLALLLAAASAGADHQNGHTPPVGPMKAHFPAGFPALTDAEWSFRLGGFGGIRQGAPLKHVPVIFVHGNNVDHADWYHVRDDFKAAGWTDQELWGLSYNGVGNDNGNTPSRDNPAGRAERAEMGGDGIARITANDVNVPDLHAFVTAVRAYTGSKKFTIVAHSLGVTVARKMLKVHPALRADLVAFVGIAGGNHGTSLCPPGSEGNVYACDEIAANTPWLAELNGPDGSDETYPPAKWMTVYEGTGTYDVAFMGTYAQSPVLKGADNRQYPFTNHNQLRVAANVVADYRAFIENAEKPYLAAPTTPAPKPAAVLGDKRELAATGVPGALFGAGALTLGAAAFGALTIRKRTR
ncbi:MAG TPA: alpha/beta fold hydrolase [Actinomycetota bacterium]|nr:alpha/beta fold hydrolase [Actinomycetota bacterium]